jgi:hypothetical protein
MYAVADVAVHARSVGVCEYVCTRVRVCVGHIVAVADGGGGHGGHGDS